MCPAKKDLPAKGRPTRGMRSAGVETENAEGETYRVLPKER